MANSPSRVDGVRRVDAATVTGRLEFELREAAAAARHGGELDLARSLDDRADVMHWATSLRDAPVGSVG